MEKQRPDPIECVGGDYVREEFETLIDVA
jgi:hypothetical protein